MRILRLLTLVFLVIAATILAYPQVRPVNDQGALGLGQMLRRLQTTASVMMIGAHPDDEDSALLAYLARGENARTAYLSLTRGDGGQNIIGPELFEALGVIRTEELLQARRLDGAEQYFTSAFDYGFSKTLDEAKQKWPEDVVLCDVVRAIRRFQPLVVISRFSGTPADGHGHHQYAGYITPLAVKAAADGSKCGGLPWKVKKLYVEQGFSDTSQSGLRLNTGRFDPLLGRSYFEIAMEGRSQHRSQGEGRLELRGSIYSGLRLVDASPLRKESSVFDGIDTTIAGESTTYIAEPKMLDPAIAAKLLSLQGKLVEAAREYRPLDSAATLERLIEVKRILYDVGVSYRNDRGRWESRRELDTGFWKVLSVNEQQLDRAIVIAAGIQVDALAERETVSANEDLPFTVRTFFPEGGNVTIKEVRPLGTCLSIDSAGCREVQFDPGTEPANTQQTSRRETPNDIRYFIAHFRNFPVTQPYWLRTERHSDIFPISNIRDEYYGLPFEPSPIVVQLIMNVGGVDIRLERPLEFRYSDPARGEVRREVSILPEKTLNADRSVVVVPFSETAQTRRVSLIVRNNSLKLVAGKIAAWNPEWQPVATEYPFELKGIGETATIDVGLTIPARTSPGRYTVVPRFVKNDISADYSVHSVSYPHIQTHRYYTWPRVDVRVIDLKSAAVSVGYIMGSGDDVPDAIRQTGLNVTMIDDIGAADLSKFDTVVVGIRASEVRPDFAANNQKLLEYVKNGGNLIVQYQRPAFIQQKLTPFPASMADAQRTAAGSISRVVDETAKVTILDPSHPVFTYPNKINDADFGGWIQERNLYNFVTFDRSFTPLLESHDPGEQPNTGGMVIAAIGKGTYIYTSYSWFRQLPAGVPGAYRIFANMLSLPRANSKKP